MKINRNQKSVLSLCIVFLFGLIVGGGSVFSTEAIVVWTILGALVLWRERQNKTEAERAARCSTVKLGHYPACAFSRTFPAMNSR